MSRLVEYIFAQTSTPNLAPLPKVSADAARIQTILSLVFVILGSVAVIYVILGGIKYMLSQGDPQETAKAKNTIIYAVVGLVLSIMSVTIVQFTLGHV